MIPDYLIEVAMDAYAEASGQSVSRPWMEAAFNAVAADIWDEGYEACEDDVSICTNWNTETPNPYKRNEHA